MRAYHNRGALEEQMRSGASHLTGLRGAMEALAAPHAEAAGEDPDSRPRGKPITEWPAEGRHRHCGEWWARAYCTMMLDAAGWEAGDIADFLGRPTEDIAAILEPKMFARTFDVFENGALLIDADAPPEAEGMMAEHYNDSVAYLVDGWLEDACCHAADCCGPYGFGDFEPILRDRERRHRRRREAAEGRGIGPFPFLFLFEHPDYEAAGALYWCVMCDAEHAVGAPSPEKDGADGWSDNLFMMWKHHHKALKGLNKKLGSQEQNEEDPGAGETPGS
jgi:hypothetical protein